MTEKQRRGREHVAAWKASGLRRREYCRRNGLSLSTLCYWSSRVNGESKAGGFVEVVARAGVEPPERCEHIELFVRDRYRLSVGDGFRAEVLSRVLDVLERR
ncbi:MAG: IS66 family insertion sequence element accessory protein TnpA [Terriglobia bacterium]